MATSPQYLHGPTRPVDASFDTTDATVAFNPGDMVVVTNGYVYRATNTGANFLGVCAQRKTAGTTGLAKRLFGNSTDGIIRVDTDGEFTFDRSDSIALTVGDMVIPTDHITVAKTTTESISIGRVVRNVGAVASNRVRVKIQSRMVPSGPTA